MKSHFQSLQLYDEDTANGVKNKYTKTSMIHPETSPQTSHTQTLVIVDSLRETDSISLFDFP